MNNNQQHNVSFRFLPMGTVAPDNVPSDEIWLDVGNRAGPRVMDHHGGDTDAPSAAQLILDKYSEYISGQIFPDDKTGTVNFVLHSHPDLDAVCSAWLANKIITKQSFPEPFGAVEAIVRAVSENDQGLVTTQSPESCWPIIMRLLINIEFAEMKDGDKVVSGMKMIDRTLAVLKSGKNLDEAALTIITPAVQSAIHAAKQNYQEDLSRATLFQIHLPMHPVRTGNPLPQKGSSASSPVSDTQWSPADAIYLNAPTSILFKELARKDKERSKLRQGFTLMVVSRDLPINVDRPVRRYTISTDPLSGFHLQGLGKLLEKAEQIKEDNNRLPLFEGRERVGKGKGRHGCNVLSPWYDGRGHRFTIVDSPSVTIEGKNFCASSLSPEEIMEILLTYGGSHQSVQR